MAAETDSAVTPTGAPLALAALLAGTLVGTVGNSVVNVPLSSILADFDAPLTSGVFVVVGFLLAFAASMPLAGWVGDRFGRRKVYCLALIATIVCSLGAATAPSLEVLITWRTLGGIAAAPFAPVVMGLIQWLFWGEQRSRAIGAWASVNGLGQAIGPTMGGLVADAWGWRWVFVPLIPVALIGLIGTLRHIPATPGRRASLDVVGAVTLTVGAATLVFGLAQIARPDPVAIGALIVGAASLVWFTAHSLRTPAPFVDLRLASESRFLRSTLAAFAQMFTLNATLVAIPLYLVSGGASESAAGLTLFAVPAVMALLGPPVGRYMDQLRPRRVLRTGLILLILAEVALALLVGRAGLPTIALLAALALVGAGAGLVQTPAANGATKSPAGQQGTGLGLFNLVRFTGSAAGAAWVAVALDVATLPTVFWVAAGMALVGLAASFVGPDPERTPWAATPP
ncbi:MFS transporter [Mycolicibacterium brumae]|uniref:MFS transporter n=1 Tax=Mycolicibacterium brumae TaxID=85968 RepID=A0A2G5PE12_9MYCO|nr:MFS transporter [Mycolicibacterium brumae]MCV7192706.1 MFS transporter [Mycolicibacterium brumae]PIB76556.1 MFS transporter [Mycolicibacterium brumae]RWA23292.1 hypothetical protein MBRU_00300 [Mycolicibacterium brumae DSM 44177]UWW08780.1 MFS transporter [Mycolicibacterium brumae]